MEQAVRAALRKAVVRCRELLSEDIARQLEGRYGIRRDGTTDPVAALRHLDQKERGVAEKLREVLQHEAAHGHTAAEAVRHLTREICFTYLNRLVALRLMEQRDLIPESVSRGRASAGFALFRRIAPGAFGEDVWRAYRHYLEALFDEVGEEVGVLFDRRTPGSLVFPDGATVDGAVEILSSPELYVAWQEDETIGWVYQYFTPREERQAARQSQVPRSSYELAIRNQFYTPRYVVRFLVDNTLGRLWYEMRRGRTELANRCTFMIRFPDELFLDGTASPPAAVARTGNYTEDDARLVRPGSKKDPREIRILDPACGSGHFLLYCFDLLEVMYEEAYDDPDLGPRLRADFPDRAEYRRQIPVLILENNLHGVDIDLRATQIAAFALWLRAQRSPLWWGIPRGQRPRITRTNVVTAEPMPGNLREFLPRLPARLHDVAADVWKMMRLASEAGSLLQVKEEVQATCNRHRDKFPLAAFNPDSAWGQAEEVLLDALREHAEAVANGGQYARKLFRDDAAAGIAFIDVMSKNYDVILMNPPFGEGTKLAKDYMQRKYPRSKNDIYAAFVERALQLLAPGGRLGVITSRTGFFLTTYQRWREEVLLQEGEFKLLADLGFGVMDDAMVEAAAYVVERPRGTKDPDDGACFVRLLKTDPAEKASALEATIAELADGHRPPHVYRLRPASFSLVPGSPFAYWVSESLRNKFKEFPPFEGYAGTVKQGLATADDFRFVRAAWEVPPETIAGGPFPAGWKYPGHDEFRQEMLRQLSSGKRWAFFAKGGEYSPYYADIHLVVNWENNGHEIRHFARAFIRNERYYFRPGLTWTLRTIKGLNLRMLPCGCVFGHKGPGLFLFDDALAPSLLALGNSSAFRTLVSLQMAVGSWEVGVIQRTPVPVDLGPNLARLGLTLAGLARQGDTLNELARMFVTPWETLASVNSLNTVFEKFRHVEALKIHVSLHADEVDEVSWNTYRVSPEDRVLVETTVSHNLKDHSGPLEGSGELPPGSNAPREEEWLAGLLSYCVGCAMGRWDVRVGRETRLAPMLPDLFDPPPVCPPGMLVGPDGLPAKPGGIVSEEWLRARPSAIHLPPEGVVKKPTISDDEYPIRIAWNGILVDEEGHRDDIVARVREVLEYLWGDRAHAIEREACEMLGVGDLREFFRSPRGFFDFHIKRYSRSRRKAPIYWYLCSTNRRYGVWLYYHRLSRDTLFTVLHDYVQPRLDREEQALEALMMQANGGQRGGAATRSLLRKIDEQRALCEEIGEFRDRLVEVLRLKAEAASGLKEVGYEPDLHDGVLINVAPLRKLVPWSEAERTWEELAAGRYDWSTMARRLWPLRSAKGAASVSIGSGRGADESELERRVLHVLPPGTARSRTELQELTGLDSGGLSRVLRGLTARGVVGTVGRGRGTRYLRQ
ncbi:MAG: BREX-1 system adenine-specific DNA-methyltransferase PglX [Bacillota bacterium]|nr:BREX-1 system adenine-specific DNA-methyltransferase PglX [Bacillota bacterium]